MTKSPYTPADLEMVERIKAWLAQHNLPRAYIASKSKVPGGTVSQILNGKYVSSPTRQLNEMMAVVELETERLADGAPGYVRGSVHKLFNVVADRTRKHRSFGIFTGKVGVGKTATAKEYQGRKPQTLLVLASPNMTPGVLLVNLLEQLGVPVPGGLDPKFQEVVRAIKGTNHLILVDEAENCSPQALHYVRRIRDMAEIGVVLIGTEKLHALIKPQHGQFDQIRSRVAMWPKTVETITRDDADDMAQEALKAIGEPSDEVLDRLWAYGKGSARMLMENLIPAIKDYLPEGKTLTASKVDQIAETILFMKGAV